MPEYGYEKYGYEKDAVTPNAGEESTVASEGQTVFTASFKVYSVYIDGTFIEPSAWSGEGLPGITLVSGASVGQIVTLKPT